MWIDGSPSSGFEQFCMVEQLQGRWRQWQRLMTVTFLGFGFMGLAAKVPSMIHVLWMESGSVETIRRRFRGIRGICTDFGTEAEIADRQDLLPDYLRIVGIQIPCKKGEVLTTAVHMDVRMAPPVRPHRGVGVRVWFYIHQH